MASLGRRMFPALCAVCKHRQSICKPVTLPQLVKKFHFQPATINSVRSFSSTMSTETKVQKEKVSITFNLSDGRTSTVQAKVGDNLLDVIIDNDVDIDGFGACEGTLACSTCHLIFAPADFERLEEKATDEELDMLDLAYELTDTSRLGCQVIVAKDMDGLVVDVPCGVADARDV